MMITSNVFAALSLSPSTTANVSIGLSYKFTISGGTGFYTITSSDDSVATASVTVKTGSEPEGEIEGISSGTAVLTVEDSGGETIDLDVVVSSLTLSLAKTQLSLMPQETGTVSVTSGSGFYKVSSSDDTVAVSTIDNDIITINGVNAGSAVITVIDSTSQTATIDISVGASSFTVSPSKIILSSTGDTEVCTLSDPNNFYQVSSSDETIATAVVFNNLVTIISGNPGSATITVVSSNSETASIDVTVTNKNSLNVLAGEIKDFDMSTIGGTGFYQASINDETIASISFSGNNAKVTGLSSGKTKILITDSALKSYILNVVVPLEAPVLAVKITGNNANLSWAGIVGADTYILYYAPNDSSGNPQLNQIQFVDIGNVLFLDVSLPPGESYSTAIQAAHATDIELASLVSNIESITIQ